MSRTETFKDPDLAFQQAITRGYLSASTGDPNYAGKYMYMGTSAETDDFKNIDTREYLRIPSEVAK